MVLFRNCVLQTCKNLIVSSASITFLCQLYSKNIHLTPPPSIYPTGDDLNYMRRMYYFKIGDGQTTLDRYTSSQNPLCSD